MVTENGERCGRLEVRMDKVEEGVSNFIEFQKEARVFFTTFDVNEANRKETDSRRAKIHYALLTMLIGMVLAMFTFILSKLPEIHIGFGAVTQSSQETKIPPLMR
jgi:hypothetical protein